MMRGPSKITLIDDNPDFLFTTGTFLKRNGYEVWTAEDGSSGIELSREKSCEIIITDIQMPGMDGIEVLKRIKETDPEKEVIVVTGHGEMEKAIGALQLDASDFITKPINHDALLVALGRAKERFTTRKELHEYTTLLEEEWMDTAEELARMIIFRKNLIESSIDGIMGCDKEGKVITLNQSMEKMLGYSQDEVVGQISFDEFFQVGEAERFREELYSEDYGGKNRLVFLKTVLVAKTGIKIPVQLSATVLYDESEEIGIVGFFRDLREIRRLEQQFADQARLLHEDKLISLGRLAASVAHEINNPLAGVLNYIRLMIKILNKSSLTPEYLQKFQRYVSITGDETAHCSKIVSNLLSFTRKSELKSIEININDLLEKCIMLSQHKLDLQNIRIKTDLDQKNPKVWGDFNQIQQCMINLIFNAIDAMPEGGTLSIKSSFNPNEGIVEIRVEDTGRGIPKEDLPNIFDPFYTTKMEEKGLGLGFSTVYSIIDRHKGTIIVDSELAKGTVFRIKLPAGERGS